MKTKTTFYIAVIAIISCLFLSFNLKQDTPKKYITIRVLETSTLLTPIVIAYEDGKMEEYEIGSLKEIAKNTKTMNDLLNDFVAKGYKLEFFTTTGTTRAHGDVLTTYLMSK